MKRFARTAILIVSVLALVTVAFVACSGGGSSTGVKGPKATDVVSEEIIVI